MKKIPMTDRGRALALGLLAAVLASACCLLPALLLLMGAGALAGLVAHLKGVFMAASVAILLGGSILLLRKRSGDSCCPGSRPALSPPLLTVLLLATFGISYAAFQGITPALAAGTPQAPKLPLVARGESRVLDLQIQGMTCGSCTVGIEAVLRAKPGVEEAKVDFGSASARVVYDASRISTQEILEAVRETGYKASLSGGARTPSSVVGGCC